MRNSIAHIHLYREYVQLDCTYIGVRGKDRKKMKKPNTVKTKPKVTDWIQAIAAAISIPAAIIACIIFFQKDKELQHQINRLDIIAVQSLKQTKLLTNQVGILKDELEFQKYQNNISLSHREIEIQPNLVIEFEGYNGDLVSASLINNGKFAKILKFKEKKPNDFEIFIPFQSIGEGKKKDISFKYKSVSERNEKTVLNFTLIYEDIDKHIHSKDFKFMNIEGIINRMYSNKMITN